MDNTYWSAEWRSTNNNDRHLLHENGVPVLFSRRKSVEAWIRKHYGYIATRKDLRAAPHGWRMPRPIRVAVVAPPPAE